MAHGLLSEVEGEHDGHPDRLVSAAEAPAGQVDTAVPGGAGQGIDPAEQRVQTEGTMTRSADHQSDSSHAISSPISRVNIRDWAAERGKSVEASKAGPS